jgi:hypothetical protein
MVKFHMFDGKSAFLMVKSTRLIIFDASSIPMVVDASRSARTFGAELCHDDPDGRGRGGKKWPGRQGEIRHGKASV